MHVVEWAQEVIDKEIAGLKTTRNLFDQEFVDAVSFIHETRARVVVCGMGKSGLVGKKISSTLASTGTVSFFIHPSEAFHGDLGMLRPEDIIITISNSGETDELIKLLPFLKSNGNKIISITANANSTLGINSDYVIKLGKLVEACPLELAPTTSTTATLAIGDAMAVSLMKLSGFKEEHYAKFHPGGNLGRKLLCKVKDVMVAENLPIVEKGANFSSLLNVMTTGRLGMAVVLDHQKLFGVVTDGDLRRWMEKNNERCFHSKVEELCSTNPRVINKNEKIIVAEQLMHEQKISSLVVLDETRAVVGVLQIYQTN
jgi:arabinose-5-phosphate isomerase